MEDCCRATAVLCEFYTTVMPWRQCVKYTASRTWPGYCALCDVLLHALQTTAEADAKQAEVRGKHAAKRLSEQRKASAGKAREAAALAKDMAAAEAAVAACERRCTMPQGLCLHYSIAVRQRAVEHAPAQ